MKFSNIKNLDNLLDKFSLDTGLTGESHRYDFGLKVQDDKTPPDVKFPPDTDIEIQHNDYVSPTTTPAEGIENNNNKSNTSFDDLDNEQIDMAHPNKSAFIGIKTLDELIHKHALPQIQYTIFCDLDQVLVDFDGGFAKIFGEGTPNEFMENYSKNKFFKKLRGYPHFFRELGWMSDGPELWNYIKPFSPVILTAPVNDMPYCADDKINWVKENLGEGVQTIVAADKSVFASSTSILIDDRDKNVLPWNEADGIAIKHFSAQDTIEKLREILEDTQEALEASPVE